MRRQVVVFSLYGNPIHKGHVEYAENARKLAGPEGLVYAIVNNDQQAVLKKGYSFVPESDRVAVVGALRYVDKVFLSIDTDRTVCKTLQTICDSVGDDSKPTMFFNEGDVTPSNRCPEETICNANGIRLVYGEGPKIQSSSWILEKSVKAAHDRMFPPSPSF